MSLGYIYTNLVESLIQILVLIMESVILRTKLNIVGTFLNFKLGQKTPFVCKLPSMCANQTRANFSFHLCVSHFWIVISDATSLTWICKTPMRCTVGNQADTTRMVTRGFFLLILMDSEAFIRDQKVRFVFPYIKISIKMDIKAQNLHKTAYSGS